MKGQHLPVVGVFCAPSADVPTALETSLLPHDNRARRIYRQHITMAPSLLDLISALPVSDGWGPPPTEDTMLDGVPYAPYSKGDKLGRMADWTGGKDDRGGRQNFGRNYRGMCYF